MYPSFIRSMPATVPCLSLTPHPFLENFHYRSTGWTGRLTQDDEPPGQRPQSRSALPPAHGRSIVRYHTRHFFEYSHIHTQLHHLRLVYHVTNVSLEVLGLSLPKVEESTTTLYLNKPRTRFSYMNTHILSLG